MPEMDQTISLFSLKGEARHLVENARATGNPISHAQALERVARQRGFANWNACSAHFSDKPMRQPVPRTLEDFDELEDPAFWFSANQMGGLSRSVGDLSAWARRLDLLADSTDPGAYTQMIALMGERKPYMFERNRGRWSDGKFHLVDRGYEPYKHVAFTEEELERLGFKEWANSRYSSGVDDGYFAMDDQFGRRADPVGLKWLARMLMAVARMVYEQGQEPAKPA